MSVIFFMIGISLLMALGFLGAFIWSMRTGQQDDLYTPSLRMLLDDTVPEEPVNQLSMEPKNTSANTL
ncbi:cbb3-type cytochrome oxidase assembly protein CcoS [Spirosoma montaniterrae]|uniref:Cytochrome C oxidase Cbb3 n=1 Tax=Spirosoma montaniterrae TaxID=1178516 RepID=A0A1P9WU49_9BACT|nr:cbb3-type cytochrome oxidase assembly protein CcoS [Spirosoma montaniterrae]AQG78911.1 cytochrome C oxidase Cbb3 [Spirosoma montaniterrae]